LAQDEQVKLPPAVLAVSGGHGDLFQRLSSVTMPSASLRSSFLALRQIRSVTTGQTHVMAL